jgi:hypothetical protein
MLFLVVLLEGGTVEEYGRVVTEKLRRAALFRVLPSRPTSSHMAILLWLQIFPTAAPITSVPEAF